MKKLITFFICRDDNKVVLARQFQSMTKQQLFEYSGHFYKNIGYHKDKSSFEYGECSYVYMIVEGLYLVLVGNNQSNIFESSSTLKTIYRRICDICKEGGITEDGVKINAYDIILSVDDITSRYGADETNYSELVKSSKMESFDEKDYLKAQKEKEDIAKANIVKGVEEIELMKRENRYVGNAVSSEVFFGQKEAEEEVRNLEREHQARMRAGMNLRDHLIQRLMMRKEEELRMSRIQR